jgi:hypothetical protein
VCVSKIDFEKAFEARSTRSLFMAQMEAYLQELVQELSRGEWLQQRSRQIPQTLQNAPSDTAECSKRIMSEAKALGSS